MPAVSKKQFKFMQAVKHGSIRKKGLSPEKASEFVDEVSYESLPKQIKKVRKGRKI